EYKFIFCAAMCLAPLTALGLDPWLARGGWRWAVALGIPLALAPLALSRFVFRAGDHIRGAPQVDESSFWLRLASSDPDAGWTDAVRRQTPPDTVVIVRQPRYHIASFTGRSLFVMGAAPHSSAGYEMSTRRILIDVRGYRSELFE